MSDTETYSKAEADKVITVISVAFIKAIDETVDDKALGDRIKKRAAANMLASVLGLLLEDEDVAR